MCDVRSSDGLGERVRVPQARRLGHRERPETRPVRREEGRRVKPVVRDVIDIAVAVAAVVKRRRRRRCPTTTTAAATTTGTVNRRRRGRTERETLARGAEEGRRR